MVFAAGPVTCLPLTVIATSLLVPLEVYELIEKMTLPRAAALIINLGAVAYLVLRLRHSESKIHFFRSRVQKCDTLYLSRFWLF